MHEMRITNLTSWAENTKIMNEKGLVVPRT